MLFYTDTSRGANTQLIHMNEEELFLAMQPDGLEREKFAAAKAEIKQILNDAGIDTDNLALVARKMADEEVSLVVDIHVRRVLEESPTIIDSLRDVLTTKRISFDAIDRMTSIKVDDLNLHV